ncbi:uncharacterized protein LOC105023383 isoform X2 [Esox lucius]|uniref:uncharacterized protein LOC105023383 isoform X2 n=1 Tax=Esox lucius TaxID=8010 RepID=UPI00147695BA|nr:uncharacterized protein LOC105023383 isoform X2 [Esox lucius]
MTILLQLQRLVTEVVLRGLILKEMADLHSGKQSESCGSSAEKQQLKRDYPGSPNPGAPHLKTACRHTPSSDIALPETSEMQAEPAVELHSGGAEQKEDPEWAVQTHNPSGSRRKSWRRSTRGRHSLSALPNTCQALCRSISRSLPEEERLEKLMEASMRLAVEKLQDSLSTTPDASLESLQAQVEVLQKEWFSLAKDLRSHTPTASDPGLEQIRETIHRLQTERASWKLLLEKHRSKAKELDRRVEQGQEVGLPLDPSRVAQSSQSQLILAKPDYHSVLARQQPLLHTVDMVINTQCKMIREVLSIQESSELLLQEMSRRLAADAGFQDLSSDPVRSLLAVPSMSSGSAAPSTMSS